MLVAVTIREIRTDFQQGKRLFIKDVAKFFVPPGQRQVSIAPSLIDEAPAPVNRHTFLTKGAIPNAEAIPSPPTATAPHSPSITESGNPTVVPYALLKQFQFVFLIRKPRDTIPSYYRLTFEPYSSLNGMYYFLPNDCSLLELRVMFDYLRSIDVVGPASSQQNNHPHPGHQVCVIDSDDLLDKPGEIMRKFCDYIGIEYLSDMLNFTEIEGETHAATNLKHWGNAFHEEAMNSTRLLSRSDSV